MASRSAILVFFRPKTTSAQCVAARAIDPTFEKLMDGYKHLLRVLAVSDLILASPASSLPLRLLSAAAPRLRGRLPRFLRSFPRVFSLSSDPSSAYPQPLVRLTPAAARIAALEGSAASPAAAADRLCRLLSLSRSRSLPLRAVFRVWRELGLPDHFEDSVLAANPHLFAVEDNPKERNTHVLKLVQDPAPRFTAAAEEWRRSERVGRTKTSSDEADVRFRFGFKLEFPPGMRLTKKYRARVKAWQCLPYAGPYEAFTGEGGGGGGGGGGGRRPRGAEEKRAVGIAHEFLSLTVERMVEVEQFSQFRKWFGLELNVRDLFLDHPGIFYLSTKGKRHTVFLREAYARGRLLDPNPVYEARRSLLELVLMRRRGIIPLPDAAERRKLGLEERESEEEEDEEEDSETS